MQAFQDSFFYQGVRSGFVRWSDSASHAPASTLAPARIGASPLILLHGFAQSAASWNDLAMRLAVERPVYALDLVGHGASERPADLAAYALDAQAEALLAFARHVATVEGARPAVLGYSMGGRVALAAAARDPHVFAAAIDALVLEAAGLGPATPDERAAAATRDAANAARLRADGIEAFMDAWERLPLFATQRDLAPDVRARLRAGRLANDAEALARTFEQAGQHVMPARAATRAALAAACADGLPVLYLAGSRDAKYAALARELDALAAQVVAGACGRALVRTRIVEGAGHNVHLEAPEAFVREVDGFLSVR